LDAVGKEMLFPLVDRYERVGDVRVQGCFMAIELVTDSLSKDRAPALQHQLAEAVLQRGVLVDSSTTSLNIQPSLVMPADDLRTVLQLVNDAVAATVA
jgi:4-aminobutyrate aminotransferase-like enzyme